MNRKVKLMSVNMNRGEIGRLGDGEMKKMMEMEGCWPARGGGGGRTDLTGVVSGAEDELRGAVVSRADVGHVRLPFLEHLRTTNGYAECEHGDYLLNLADEYYLAIPIGINIIENCIQ